VARDTIFDDLLDSMSLASKFVPKWKRNNIRAWERQARGETMDNDHVSDDERLSMEDLSEDFTDREKEIAHSFIAENILQLSEELPDVHVNLAPGQTLHVTADEELRGPVDERCTTTESVEELLQAELADANSQLDAYERRVQELEQYNKTLQSVIDQERESLLATNRERVLLRDQIAILRTAFQAIANVTETL
jgi:hypothetical protein